jgi:hypothetical protein
MSNEELRDYLEKLGFSYDGTYSSFYWVQKSNPGHPYTMVTKDPWIDPEVVKVICDKLSVAYPSAI